MLLPDGCYSLLNAIACQRCDYQYSNQDEKSKQQNNLYDVGGKYGDSGIFKDCIDCSNLIRCLPRLIRYFEFATAWLVREVFMMSNNTASVGVSLIAGAGIYPVIEVIIHTKNSQKNHKKLDGMY